MKRVLMFLWALSMPAASAQAGEGRVLCVFDPGGKSGDYYRLMADYATEASTWGVPVSIKAYTDEETATRDYEAGQCDGVLATGARLQRFNRFPSTIEAIGAIPSEDVLRRLVATLASSESAAQKLKQGEHETVGIIPLGAVYLFVNDRALDAVPKFSGKRIATLNFDKASPVMVRRVGAVPVSADLGTFGPQFNNHEVDAVYSSAAGYRPFELWRGLEPSGGILKRPLAQATLQLLLRSSRFSASFAKKSKDALARRLDAALQLVAKAEASIPAKYWVPIPEAVSRSWDELFLKVRLQLRDEEKAYDGAMLSALRKLRCRAEPSRSECGEKSEE